MKGMKISDIQPVKPLISVNKPGTRLQMNRKTRVSRVYPDSVFITSQVFIGENSIPIIRWFNFAR
jgi:hypothetical protein